MKTLPFLDLILALAMSLSLLADFPPHNQRFDSSRPGQNVIASLRPRWWAALEAPPASHLHRQSWSYDADHSVEAQRLLDTNFDVTPLALEAEATSSNTTTKYLTITNLSSTTLAYQIHEVSPTTDINAVSTSESALRPSSQTGVWIEPDLQATMAANDSAGYLIYLREHPDLSSAFQMNWTERGHFVASTLQQTARRSQTHVRAYLDRQGVKYQPFWIDNVIAVHASDYRILTGLTRFPEVQALRTRRTMALIAPQRTGPGEALPSTQAPESNISHVQADRVWTELGITGAGIVVANVDTGVRYTHEALKNHYRGYLGEGTFSHDYNWLDPYTHNTIPDDDHGHGSHTMGIIVGDDGGANQIGMAPGAWWIACDVFDGDGYTSDTALLTCAQWLVAPYPIGNPESPNPDRRPHIVNNSWGDCLTSYDDWFQDAVDAWHAAGIYPVFANGNTDASPCPSTPSCNTVGNPARYGNVTGVGSTGQNDGQLAAHSLWGPTDNVDSINPRGYPTLKPQVVAPGVNIRSVYRNDDTAYGPMTGTSMSTPHVAGLVALMWQAAPCLIGNYAATETLIEQTATPVPYPSSCDGEGPGNVPNHATGWGEIDAYAAVQAAIGFCDADWLPWVAATPSVGTLPGGEYQRVQVTFTCNQTASLQTQPLQGILRIVPDDPTIEPIDVDLTFFCSGQTPQPFWSKEVWIDDQKATAIEGPHTVRPDDTVVIVDRVGAAYSDTITATLTETWNDALELTRYDTGNIGTVTMVDKDTLHPPGNDALVWHLTDVAPNAHYAMTKTFKVQYGDWATSSITESYEVQKGLNQPSNITVTLKPHSPAITLEKSGPDTAVPGETIPLTLTIISDGNFRGNVVLTDTLPLGMTYAGNLTTTYGRTWEADSIIHWTSYTGTLPPPPPGDLMMDGGFEEGTPNPYWNENSTNFGTPICDEASCGIGGGSGPHTGEWWAWFGGIEDAIEAGSLDQVVSIPKGAKHVDLSFWLEIPSAETTGSMVVAIDDSDLFSVTEADAGLYPSYTFINLDASAFADGATHTLKFESVTIPTGLTSFFVDDVALTVQSDSLPPRATITFDVQVTGSPGEVVRNLANLDWDTDYTEDVHDVTVVPQIFDATWEKQVYINDTPMSAIPIPVSTEDVIKVTDQIWLSATENITFTLLEEWTGSLALQTHTATALPEGTLSFPHKTVTSTGLMTWTVANSPADWGYAITKTFALLTDTWGVDTVTETLKLGDGYRQPDPIILIFRRGIKGNCYLPTIMRDN